MWVYIETEPGCYTVGHYSPDGRYHTDSDHSDKGKAADRVAFLNGKPSPLLEEMSLALERLLKTAELFEKQASRGTGGRRGGPVFEAARKALQKYKAGVETQDSNYRAGSKTHDPARNKK